MSRKIWKFELKLTETQTIKLPEYATPLTAQIQNGTICVWFTVNPLMPNCNKDIYIFGAGSSLPNPHGDYISSVQLHGLAWHVFH